MARILPGAAHIKVRLLCQEGDHHASAGELAEALACYVEAWEALPEPREDYPDAVPILRGLSLVLQSRGDLASGLEIMLQARSRLAPAMARGLRRFED